MAKHGMRNGNSYKNQYKNYKINNRRQANKITKLERIVRQQPDNIQAKEALNRALKAPANNYPRSKGGDHACKGLNSVFGWENNHSTKRTPLSKLWHTSTNYSKWFGPSAPKNGDTANRSISLWNQFINLGFRSYGRKYKKSSR
jgi:hypothetical protein